MATRIDGKALAAKVKAQVAEKAAKLPRQPGLAVVLVGEDSASQVYVRGKEADCGECGIRSFPVTRRWTVFWCSSLCPSPWRRRR